MSAFTNHAEFCDWIQNNRRTQATLLSFVVTYLDYLSDAEFKQIHSLQSRITNDSTIIPRRHIGIVGAGRCGISASRETYITGNHFTTLDCRSL